MLAEMAFIALGSLAESPKVAHIRSKANYFRQMIYDKKRQCNQPGYEYEMPKKVKVECEKLEAKAKHLVAIANKIEDMARR